MDQRFIEMVNGGLVTSRDPALLRPGELVKTDNLVYRPYSQSLFKLDEGSVYGTASAGSPVTGLRYCAFDFVQGRCRLSSSTTVTPETGFTFDGISVGAAVSGTGIPVGTTVATKASSTSLTLSQAATVTSTEILTFDADHLLIAQVNSTYQKSVVSADTGTFSLLEAISQGPTLDAVHFANHHVLLNGTNVNRVLKSSGTSRPHGLTPIIEAPKAVVGGGGSWSLSTGIGFYSYWTTEYDRVHDIESDFTGKPVAVNITATSQKVTITRPAQINSTATHWRLYRSAKMTATSQVGADKETIFPTGFRIAELELTTNGTQLTAEDGTTTPASVGPTASSAVELNEGGRWVNPTNATGAVNGTVATLTGTNQLRRTGLILDNFGFTASSTTAPITGITVVVTARKTLTGSHSLSVKPVKMSSPEYGGAVKLVPLTTVLTGHTLGGTGDLWGETWSPADFIDGSFGIRLDGFVNQAANVLELDAVTVTIHSNASQQEGTADPFPAVVISTPTLETAVGRNGPPPIASTGDVFQNSMVLNNVLDKSLVQYSFPGAFDAFPAPYTLNFETKEQDIVTNIKTIGNVMVVGLFNQLYRVNFLPRETDADFDRGRAVELIEPNYGIVGPQAATLFTGSDGVTEMAYVSRFGIHATDGYRVRSLTQDIDWSELWETDDLGPVILINNPEKYELIAWYPPLGSSTLIKGLFLNYHQNHLKEGAMLKVSGPGDYSASVRAACLGVRRDGNRMVFYGPGFAQSTVRVHNSDVTVTGPAVRTREMFQAGFGNEWKIKEVYAHTSVYDTVTDIPEHKMGLRLNKTGGLERTTNLKTVFLLDYNPTGSDPLTRRDISKYVWHQTGEGMSIDFQLTNDSNRRHQEKLDYLVIVGEDFGEEDSR